MTANAGKESNCLSVKEFVTYLTLCCRCRAVGTAVLRAQVATEDLRLLSTKRMSDWTVSQLV